MKRILPAALALTLSLTACGGTNDTTPAADTSGTESYSDTADTGAPAQTDSPETVPPVSGTPEAATSNTAEAPEAPDTSTETSASPAAPETPEAPKASTPPEAPAQSAAPAQPEPSAAAPEPSTEQAAAVSLTDIRDKMLSDLGISDYMEISPSRLLDLYGIQEVDVAQSGSFATMSGAFPGEVILLEATDEDAAGRIAAALQNRLNEVLNQYKTYDAATYALAEACTIDTDGKIVSMLLSPEREGMLKILTDSLR